MIGIRRRCVRSGRCCPRTGRCCCGRGPSSRILRSVRRPRRGRRRISPGRSGRPRGGGRSRPRTGRGRAGLRGRRRSCGGRRRIPVRGGLRMRSRVAGSRTSHGMRRRGTRCRRRFGPGTVLWICAGMWRWSRVWWRCSFLGRSGWRWSRLRWSRARWCSRTRWPNMRRARRRWGSWRWIRWVLFRVGGGLSVSRSWAVPRSGWAGWWPAGRGCGSSAVRSAVPPRWWPPGVATWRRWPGGGWPARGPTGLRRSSGWSGSTRLMSPPVIWCLPRLMWSCLVCCRWCCPGRICPPIG